MFTGIIEKTAVVRSVGSQDLWLDVSFSEELEIGQSVACDGVCLTVVERDERGFKVELLEETKKISSFGELNVGDLVNVERAMKADGRLDGHIVQAHVEGVAVIKKIVQEEGLSEGGKPTWLITFDVPKELIKYMIHKGIIILNGIALTLTKVDDDQGQIEVAIIPHSWENTNLHTLKEGSKVNVETDVLAKYVEKLQNLKCKM